MKLNRYQRALIHDAVDNWNSPTRPEAARKVAQEVLAALEATMQPADLKDIAVQLKNGTTTVRSEGVRA